MTKPRASVVGRCLRVVSVVCHTSFALDFLKRLLPLLLILPPVKSPSSSLCRSRFAGAKASNKKHGHPIKLWSRPQYTSMDRDIDKNLRGKESRKEKKTRAGQSHLGRICVPESAQETPTRPHVYSLGCASSTVRFLKSHFNHDVRKSTPISEDTIDLR